MEFICTDSPGSNGTIERVGFTIADAICCRLYDLAYSCAWTTVANDVILRYNSSTHSTTGFSPNFLMNGVEANESEVESVISKANADKKVDLETARKLAVERTIKVHLQNAFNYNRNRRDVELKEGQIVYCKLASKVNRENYGDIYEGPFEIKRMISKNRFEIEKNGKTVVVNKANLRLIL